MEDDLIRYLKINSLERKPQEQAAPKLSCWVAITAGSAWLMSRENGKVETVCHIARESLASYGLKIGKEGG